LDGGAEHDVVARGAAALDVQDGAAAGVHAVPHHHHIARVHEVGGVLNRLERMRAVPRGGVVAEVGVHVETAARPRGGCSGDDD